MMTLLRDHLQTRPKDEAGRPLKQVLEILLGGDPARRLILRETGTKVGRRGLVHLMGIDLVRRKKTAIVVTDEVIVGTTISMALCSGQ